MREGKKKLLIIAPQNPYPPNDGGKIGIYYPIIHLARFFEVHFTFITNVAASQEVHSHFAAFGIRIYPQLLQTKDSLFGYLFNFFSVLPYKFKKYCSKSILISLQKLIQKEAIHYVWCNHPHVAWYALEIKKKAGIKIFLREHNIEYSLVEQIMDTKRNWLLKKFIEYQFFKTKRFEILCWKEFNKTFFISDSDFLVAQKANSGNGKLDLIYDSFFEQEEIAKIKKEPYSFIFTANLGTFQNEYNLRTFLEAIWIPLIEKDARWKLYVTGNSPGVVEKKMKIKLSDNNIEDLGFVTDIGLTISSKKYFISPTYIGSGIRIKVLNALAGGAVCFLTPLDEGMLQFLKDGVNIIKYNDFEDFYLKLNKLEKDELWYNSISLHAAQVGSNFSWEGYAEKVNNEIGSN